MSYSFKWQPNSEYTYFEEVDFILLKWNYSKNPADLIKLL
jgi:hypothetical protein